MISLEHIRQLQDKVNKAVDHMNTLAMEKELLEEENQLLRSRIDASENRIAELERFIDEFKIEQNEIEEGIISALKHLDSLEHAVDVLKTEPSEIDPPVAAIAVTEVLEPAPISLPDVRSEIGQGLEDVSFTDQNLPEEELVSDNSTAELPEPFAEEKADQELELF
jgi:FtsZ-binding cell division protein ZapB